RPSTPSTAWRRACPDARALTRAHRRAGRARRRRTGARNSRKCRRCRRVSALGCAPRRRNCMHRRPWWFVMTMAAAAAGCQAPLDGTDEVAPASAALATSGVDLIAVGTLDAHGGDRAASTAAPLENGVAGNALGGLGSGLAYAGWNTFVAVPDRGPNALAYDIAVDDTTSFITRFQTIHMSPEPSPPGAAPPFAPPA